MINKNYLIYLRKKKSERNYRMYTPFCLEQQIFVSGLNELWAILVTIEEVTGTYRSKIFQRQFNY